MKDSPIAAGNAGQAPMTIEEELSPSIVSRGIAAPSIVAPPIVVAPKIVYNQNVSTENGVGGTSPKVTQPVTPTVVTPSTPDVQTVTVGSQQWFNGLTPAEQSVYLSLSGSTTFIPNNQAGIQGVENYDALLANPTVTTHTGTTSTATTPATPSTPAPSTPTTTAPAAGSPAAVALANPSTPMALVTYNDGSTAVMTQAQVTAMAAEGGLASYSIINWIPYTVPNANLQVGKTTPATQLPPNPTPAPVISTSTSNAVGTVGWFNSNPTGEAQLVYLVVSGSATFIPNNSAGIQAVSNLQTQQAAVNAEQTGQASSVTVTPSGGVTTVLPSGTKTTGQNTPTSTGITNTVPVPTATPLTAGQSYYAFKGSNGQNYDVSVTQYNSWSPEQQFAFQQSIGAISPTATIYYNLDGTWGYSTPQTQPKFESTGAPLLTQALLTYLQTNDPTNYKLIQSQGMAYAWGQNADVITKDIQNMIIAAPSSQQLAIAQQYGVVPSTATGIVINNGQIEYTTSSSTTETLDYFTWANQLPSNLQIIYNEAGGGQAGYNAVIQSQYNSIAYSAYLTDLANKAGGGITGLQAVNNTQTQAIAYLASLNLQNPDGTWNIAKLKADNLLP